MALSWSVEDVADWETVCLLPARAADPAAADADPAWDPVTLALVSHSLGTGIGRISEQNAAEVYARISLIERLHGPLLQDDGTPCPITAADVRRHIGLATNASSKDESRASFLKRQADLDVFAAAYRAACSEPK